MLSFAEFVGRLARFTTVELPDDVTPTTGLYDELAIDSMQVFQIVVIVESMAECLVPPDEIPSLYTMGDVFEYYRLCVQQAADIR